MRPDRGLAGVLVMGGENSRMGRPKGLVNIQGELLFIRTLREMEKGCYERIIVTNTPWLYKPLLAEPVSMISDVYPGKGPLSGFHAVMHGSPSEFFWMVGCDMPFVSWEAGLLLWKKLLASRCKLAVPCLSGQIEPLHGIYHRSCLSGIERLLESGAQSGLIRWIRKESALFLKEADFNEAGIPLGFTDSFNTPDEFDRLMNSTGLRPSGGA